MSERKVLKWNNKPMYGAIESIIKLVDLVSYQLEWLGIKADLKDFNRVAKIFREFNSFACKFQKFVYKNYPTLYMQYLNVDSALRADVLEWMKHEKRDMQNFL